VAGEFNLSNGVPLAHVGAWNGTNWMPLGAGLNGPAIALAVHDFGGGPALYAGGDFTLAGGQPASRIARWDGASWTALGGGTNGTVRALCSFDDGNGPRLYAGGDFTTAGGQTALRVGAWNGAGWSSVAHGFDKPVRALAKWNDGSGSALFAGGDFGSSQPGRAPVRGIARLGPAGWTEVGGGIAPQTAAVHCLLAFDGLRGSGSRLWVGGSFAQAGGFAHNELAAWNGASWSSPPQKPNDTVRALARFDGTLGPALAVAGDFSHVGGVPFGYVGLWDGFTWTKLGLGLELEAPPIGCRSLAQFVQGSAMRLYAGGGFVAAGGLQSLRIARWGDPCSPPQFLEQPKDQVAEFNKPVFFDVEAQGTLPLSYQWRRDGIDLVDGPGVEGTATPNLVLFVWDWNDQGAYDCVVSNSAGWLASDSAQLTVPGGGLTGEPLELEPAILPPHNVSNVLGAHFTLALEPLQAATNEVTFLGELDIGGDCLARLEGDSASILFREGDQAPGLPFGLTLGQLNAFESPFRDFVVGKVGRLEFAADLAGPNVGPANRTAIWMRDALGTELVAREGNPLAGVAPGGVLRDPSSADMSDDGLVVFRGSVYAQGSFLLSGVWSWDRSNGQRLLLQQGQIAPGTAATLTAIRSRPRIARDGRVLVQGELDTVTGFNYGGMRDTGLWFGQPESLQLVAKSGDPAPGMPAGTNLEFFVDDGALADEAGRVAFSSWVAGPGGFYGQGVFHWEQGALQPIAVFGQQAPGAEPGSVFFAPRVLTLGADGAVVLESSLATTCTSPCAKHGVWLRSAGELTPIVLDGEDPWPGIPPDFTVGSFGRAALDASSRMLLELALVKDGQPWTGVMGWTPDRGLFPVIVPGMQLEVARDDYRMVLGATLPSATGGTSERDSRNLSPDGILTVELTFSDYSRAVVQEPLTLFEAFQLGPGVPFCFGDGSGTICPCGNQGGPAGGCKNSSMHGAVLDAIGSIRISDDSLAYDLRAVPPNTFALLFEGTLAPNGGLGLPFADGLLCAGGTVLRLQADQASASGVAHFGPGLAGVGQWTAGSTWNFQAWYRDPAGPCAQGSNLSNAIRVTFLP
jgi:hypothetical protein